jgi:short-subunit dehydrogenase involved in D-alanine esterification of teichoic acids
VVFISGGGTGLGKGMAFKFSQLGAKVAIASRSVHTAQVKFYGAD